MNSSGPVRGIETPPDPVGYNPDAIPLRGSAAASSFLTKRDLPGLFPSSSHRPSLPPSPLNKASTSHASPCVSCPPPPSAFPSALVASAPPGRSRRGYERCLLVSSALVCRLLLLETHSPPMRWDTREGHRQRPPQRLCFPRDENGFSSPSMKPIRCFWARHFAAFLSVPCMLTPCVWHEETL